MAPEYSGRCHCGRIGFQYRTAVAPQEWPIRACQCSFCRAHEVLSTSDPSGFVEFTIDDPTVLSRYRFGLQTADFLVCRECGVYIGALIETDQGQFAIINTRALATVPANLSRSEPISYDMEDAAERASRRQRRWTPAKL